MGLLLGRERLTAENIRPGTPTGLARGARPLSLFAPGCRCVCRHFANMPEVCTRCAAALQGQKGARGGPRQNRLRFSAKEKRAPKQNSAQESPTTREWWRGSRRRGRGLRSGRIGWRSIASRCGGRTWSGSAGVLCQPRRCLRQTPFAPSGPGCRG